MDEKKNVKICFAASSGGHYEQLMMLKPLMEKYDGFVITEKTDYSAEAKGEKTYYIGKKSSKLTVGSVQNFLDKYLKENGGKIDYIHGKDTLKNLVKDDKSAGIILPDMDKSDLFPTVILDGSLPRKTFSMGHAEDKRYYIEARKIIK